MSESRLDDNPYFLLIGCVIVFILAIIIAAELPEDVRSSMGPANITLNDLFFYNDPDSCTTGPQIRPVPVILMFFSMLIAAYFIIGGYFCLPGGIQLNSKKENKEK